MAGRNLPSPAGFLTPKLSNLKTPPIACINHGTTKLGTNPVPLEPSNPAPNPQSGRPAIIAAGLLLAALALVVLYTSQRAFRSPVALVVVAAIGVAALLLQLRLRPDLPSSARASIRGPLWLNAIGVVFAIAAVFADILHLNGFFVLIAALAALISFAISGIIVLNALRKRA
jgi:hypothetical protein